MTRLTETRKVGDFTIVLTSQNTEKYRIKVNLCIPQRSSVVLYFRTDSETEARCKFRELCEYYQYWKKCGELAHLLHLAQEEIQYEQAYYSGMGKREWPYRNEL